jgi:hypothetical protein
MGRSLAPRAWALHIGAPLSRRDTGARRRSMHDPFPAWSNTVVRIALIAVVALVVGVPGLLMLWVRTPYETDQLKPIDQPVEFDHRHHALDDGIDCKYCHSGADRSAYAGIPPSSVCMGCHGQIWSSAPLLEPVRTSYFQNTPISWQRVYRLPDFVFFNHAVHTRRGVGCATCHGRVDEQARVYRVVALSMAWCLECHRRPEEHLRPQDRVTDMAWKSSGSALELGRQIRRELSIDPPTSCSGCHR